MRSAPAGALLYKRMRRHFRAAIISVVMMVNLLPLTSARAELALFDAHLHFTAADEARYAPEDIVSLLRANNVRAAVITGRPPDLVLPLHRLAPQLIVPLLGVYRTPAEKQTWGSDAGLPARVEQALAGGPWHGVGELHLFAAQRYSPVFLRIVELATSRGLPLLMHCDPAVIDTLFERVPAANVIWAHAGAYPYPPLLRDYLERYPGLSIDLSVRDRRIAPDGFLDPAWELLLLEYSERFLIGVDTYLTDRWDVYPVVIRQIRNWLVQLPEEVSEAIGHGNGRRLFGRPPDR